MLLRPHSALPLVLLLAPLSASLAQDGVDGQAALNIHVTAADFSLGPCGAYAFEGEDCATSSHDPIAGEAFLFVVASNADGWFGSGVGTGIRALQFGIEYTGLDVISWYSCAGGLELPQNDADGAWPESGTGNAVTWADGCYDPGGETAAVGLFHVSDASSGEITPTIDPREGAPGTITYTDCALFTWEILLVRGANLGGPSEPVCGYTPVVESHWGEVKAAFRSR